MTSAFLNEQALEKQIQRQMGCMAGFLQIFDRHHILTGKRLYLTKRLPPSPPADSTPESEKSPSESPAATTIPQKPKKIPATDFPTKSPPPIVELKQGNRRKLCKEAPRLSLDSRATTDAKGGLHPKQIRTIATTSVVHNGAANGSVDGDQQQHRSHSVIARLMGLDPFPNSSDSEPEKKPELRRSASESRVSKDLFQSRFTADGGNLYPKQPSQSHSVSAVNNATKDNPQIDAQFADPRNNSSIKKANQALNRGRDNSTSIWRAPQQRRNFFDSGDVFPEPKQSTVSIYGEIEKRIKMRGIDEPSNDLETLKQILEALQLKGLLHPKPPSPQQNQVSHRNFVYDESPIVLMKPSRSATPISRRMGNDYSPSNGKIQFRGARRNNSIAGETSTSVSPRRERHARSPTRGGRGPSTITRNAESSARSNSPVKPRQLSVETQRRVNEATEKRGRASPVHSPKRAVADATVSNRSPRSKNPTSEIRQREKITNIVVTEDESSSISGSSVTTSTESERWKGDEYSEGRNILARCDKLLHSISEMAAADMQPSPVSVLDPSFDKDESLTPSPVTIKRNIDFKDHSGDLEEETGSPVISPIRTKCLDISDESDFTYISDILRASQYLPEESDVFLLLEKQQFLKGNDTSKISSLQRKLIFDTINEIVDKNKQRPPWKAFPVPLLDKVWSDFQNIREPETADDLFETICGVLKRDLAGDGWGEFTVENSEAVLEIERLIFKDVICEAIRDFTALPTRCTLSFMRKLVF